MCANRREDGMLVKFITFGMLGICGTLLVRAFMKSITNRRLELTGELSLILFPLFGLIAIFYPITAIHIGGLPWYLRGVIYTLAFFVAQYITGLGLRRLGLCPWQYPPKWSLNGLVNLWDAPIWFLAGLAIEWVYPQVKIASNALS